MRQRDVPRALQRHELRRRHHVGREDRSRGRRRHRMAGDHGNERMEGHTLMTGNFAEHDVSVLCPWCQSTCERATAVAAEKAPKAGGMALCIKCGCWSIVT